MESHGNPKYFGQSCGLYTNMRLISPTHTKKLEFLVIALAEVHYKVLKFANNQRESSQQT